MTQQTIGLIEEARRRLHDRSQAVSVAGPATDAQIATAEESLGCVFPPSYREFLRRFGALQLPSNAGVVHDFIGISGQGGVVERTLSGRTTHRLTENLIIVGLGADHREWFCLDVERAREDGECPVMLFDTKDQALDQQFYDDFGQMLAEVFGFVVENLDHPPD